MPQKLRVIYKLSYDARNIMILKKMIQHQTFNCRQFATDIGLYHLYHIFSLHNVQM